jgi:hypothetical protein
MERLSDWRAFVWVAVCFAAIATAAALLIPAGTKKTAPVPTKPEIHASLVPRTHLFGQPVTASVEIPATIGLKTSFAPYRVISRSVTRHGSNLRYRFVIDCLTSQCVGQPGAEQPMELPPVTLLLPGGKKFVGYWPPLRQASRLAPADLQKPMLRGDLTAPETAPPPGRHTWLGILLALAAATALGAAGVLGLRKLGWRPEPFWADGNGHRQSSDLDYALLVAGLAAGSGAGDRRAALESLAVALEQRGLGDLAGEARDLAWSPRPPAGEKVRRLAESVQRASKEHV